MNEQDPTLDEFVGGDSDVNEKKAEELARKTVCGIPPSDWSVVRLGEVVSIMNGNSLPTEYQDESGGKHPVYKVSDMNKSGNQKYVSTVNNRLSKEDLEELNHTLYPEKTTILPKVGAALLTNKRRMLTEPSSFDNNVMGWVPEKINPEFLYYVSCMINMETVAQKGAVPSISKSIAQSVKVPSPPLEEQRKIATVIYTVDQAIQNSEDIISRLESIRIGTLRDLFTRGIGKNDTKETPMGKFPQNWEMKQMSSVGKLINGSAFPKEYQGNTHGDYPFVKVSDTNEYRRYVTGAKNYISEAQVYEIGCNIHPEGTVILPKRGAAIMTNKRRILAQDSAVDNNQIGIVGEDVEPLFLYYYLSDVDMGRFVQEGAVKSLTKSLLSMIRVPVPPTETQSEIVDILDTIDTHVEAEVVVKSRYKQLKQGLMQDLLSGEVRTQDKYIELVEDVLQHG